MHKKSELFEKNKKKRDRGAIWLPSAGLDRRSNARIDPRGKWKNGGETVGNRGETTKNSEKTLAQQEKTANAEAKRLELQLRLMEAESKARLENAQVKKTEAEALKTMADVEVMYNDAQKRQADQLLEELTALPAALPTSEELMNEQSIVSGESEQGGLPSVVEQSSNQSNDSSLDQRMFEPEPTEQPTEPVNIGSGELPTGQGVGLDGGLGLQEPTNGDMQEGV